MSVSSRVIIALWLMLLIACGTWIFRCVSITADLAVFLPPSATPAQRVLLTQVREGAASRLMLIGLEGQTGEFLAQSSRVLARRLRERLILVRG